MIRARMCVVFALAFAACGKSGGGSDTAPVTEPEPTETATEASPVEDASTPDAVAIPAPDANELKDPTTLALERVSELEVPGFTRTRSQLQSGYVTVAFDTPANAAGNSATIEMTLSVCRDCVVPVLKDVEANREPLIAALGELHAKNKDLVFDIVPLELMPQRSGVATYARSFVSDDVTRAALHTLDVGFGDNGFLFRFLAYPRSAMPATADDLAKAYSRAELEASVRTVFTAANAAVYAPPQQPE